MDRHPRVTHRPHHHHPPPGAGRRVVAEGLSSQLVRPLWGLTGETRSRPGVTVAGGPRDLQGQRDESDDGRDSLGSCCPEDLSVACRPLSGELTHAPADPRALYRASDEHYHISLGRRLGAPKWVPGWCGWRGGGGGDCGGESLEKFLGKCRRWRPHGPA